ncbi:iron-siderophore ABC transporter substrate-binding protein [Poseidonocella sp. HB161398]|uniref:iron-siderophore ABC transporter substrate-binding protein n=1 Tax=Poseidonocella sp. HB161398 TaxID=2320855 RepID=UPI001109FB79|nr:iron-siderophore ABC transporter substrate-binding protein [Poseidonocella sp. HB161398]
MVTRPGRRAVLGGLLAAVACPAQAGGARLAAIDWAMLETALMLGEVPVAACELIRYRADIGDPEVPASVIDLGLRGSPNFELLQLSRPDLILSSPWYAPIEPRLGAIAPVLSLPVYLPGVPPWPKAVAALGTLAARLGREEEARRLQAGAEAGLARLAARLAPLRDRPVYVIDLGDARHFRAFGADSMFGDVLARLGLENAWQAPSRFSFAAPVPLERLAERPEARIVTLGPPPAAARRGLARSVLWQHLPAVAEGRVTELPPLNPFGGMPSGLRFARALAAALAPEAA